MKITAMLTIDIRYIFDKHDKNITSGETRMLKKSHRKFRDFMLFPGYYKHTGVT